MPHSKQAVLETVVTRFDETTKPVTLATVAAALDLSPATVAPILSDLEGYELLRRTDGGYRPTVTARELLELDVFDEELVVLDVPEM
jgi:predicted transcriptional regulator